MIKEGVKNKETFTNEYGETWWFKYDEENDVGILTGDDNLIENETFYIFNGICPLLILNQSEENWLKETWKKYSVDKGIYLDNSIETKIKKQGIFLTNNICPLCLKKKESFEGHHCIPASEGGSDDNVNILYICKSCHTIITNGCAEDISVRSKCAICHQISIFGINFFLMNPLNNKRYKNEDMGLYENRPEYKQIIDYYNKLEKEGKTQFNVSLKQKMLYFYKYYRFIIKDQIPNINVFKGGV